MPRSTSRSGGKNRRRLRMVKMNWAVIRAPYRAWVVEWRPVPWVLMPEDPESPSALGPNAWLVDDMYDQYRANPESVSESWREFFADYHQGGLGRAPAAAPAMA